MNADFFDALIAARAHDAACAEVDADKTVTDSTYADALAAALKARADRTATQRRLGAAFFEVDSTPEAQDERARAKVAEVQRRAAIQRRHEDAVARVIEADAAEAERKAAEQALREAEQVLTIYSVPGAPTREKALARGAVKLAREELATAEDRVAKATKAPEVKP